MSFLKSSMEKVVSLYKPIGMSPVELIREFKKDNPEYENETISCAGRLDPLAYGVMVLLIGPENKKRREYEKVDKTYEFEAILGFSTDSYDICGLVEAESNPKNNSRFSDFSIENLKEIVKTFKGKQEQYFPPFSSYKIKGKPLFKYARDGRLDEIEIPKKDIEIYDIQVLGIRKVKGDKLLEDIISRINLLKGDFRQEMVIKSWKKVLDIDREYQIVSMKADVSSGTYIRGIVNELGKRLDYMCTTLEIHRTRSGEYTEGV
jgi:tRNA pseudouridine(55) synthase